MLKSKINVWNRFTDTPIGWKFSKWLYERGLTVFCIWALVCCITKAYLVVAHGQNQPEALSADGIAKIADLSLLKYLAGAWAALTLAGSLIKQVSKETLESDKSYSNLAMRMLDEFSAATSHAAFAFVLSILIVAYAWPTWNQWLTFVGFGTGSVLTFYVQEKKAPSAQAMGLTVDRLHDQSIVRETQTVTGSLKREPPTGYHLWAVREWRLMAEKGEFYPEMELKLVRKHVAKHWPQETIDAEHKINWEAPFFNFGGNPGDERRFAIIMVNNEDHKKLLESKRVATGWIALRGKANATFNEFPTPAMRWADVESKVDCISVIVQRDRPSTS